jgi:hypothetical protein
MPDHEKNKRIYEILTIELVKEVRKDYANEPVYFDAVYHQWQIDTADEMLSRFIEPKDIVRQTGLSRSTVQRRKNIFLGKKSK